MDFEERLARMIERHEALAAYFELSTREWNQRAREFDKRLRAFDKRLAVLDKRLELQTANIDKLLAIAQSHENRLHRLESNT
jgi:DNA repair exonuclease SbcCD ATPase subunit